MDISLKTALLAAAAAALVFWPQIVAFFKSHNVSPIVPSSGVTRTQMVMDCLDLQANASSAGMHKSAELLGEAATSLINEIEGPARVSPPDSKGAKK